MNKPIDPNHRISRQDFDDLQHEISGVDNGRMKRFLTNDAQSMDAKRKEREATARFNRLIDLLNDPIYRAKYEQAFSKLEEAEQATEAALAQLSQRIIHAQEALDNIQDRAARLPDGTRVYKDQSGNVRKEDGSIVDDQVLIQTIEWSDNNPNYEAYTQAQSSLIELQSQYNEVQRYQTNVLGDARNRLKDEESPQTLEGLDGLINDIEAEMPDVVSQQLSQETDGVSPTVALAMDVVPDIPIKP